ncbi:MAG TPA: hypothetical protein VLB50_12465, partial [Ignavibacteriaceae bacterium]|nr:hypothetical protein [Ignavibacteriaceae bacterium]
IFLHFLVCLILKFQACYRLVIGLMKLNRNVCLIPGRRWIFGEGKRQDGKDLRNILSEPRRDSIIVEKISPLSEILKRFNY